MPLRVALGWALPLAVAVVCVACSPGKLDSDALEARLEAGALGDEPLYGARCRAGSEGWHYRCTFRLGSNLQREKAAFMVGPDRIKKSSGALALDLPIGPAPGTPDAKAWSAFVESGTRICADRRREIAALASATKPGGFVSRMARASRIQRAELARLRRLSPPPGPEHARRFSELLKAEAALVSASDRLLTALRLKNGEAAHKAAGDVEVSSRRVDALARSVGLTRCVQTR